MSICADKDWTMDLYKDDKLLTDSFCFTNVRIIDGIIRGRVYSQNDREHFTELSGTCSPFPSRENVAHMSFFFTAKNGEKKVDIVLLGLGYQGQPVFRGGVVALEAAPEVTSDVETNFDPGETGTGSGMQAQCPPPPVS